MDNLHRTRYLLARKKLELFQQFYTEERVIRYTDMTDPFNPDQEVIINQINDAGEIINNITIGEYDIVVGITQAQDTYSDTQFAAAVEMRNAGIFIPDDVVIEASPLQKRQEIAERVRQQMGSREPSPEEMAMAQFQNNYAVQMQMLELAKAEKELETMEAERQLTLAKAQKESTEDSRLLEQLEQKIQGKREELNLRRELARMTNSTKLTLASRNNDAKLVERLVSTPQKAQ